MKTVCQWGDIDSRLVASSLVDMNDGTIEYSNKLPKQVTVKVTHDADGFAAEVVELPHCYTQAASFAELIDMVNDAIFTYLDIPTELIGKIAYYAPADILEEAKRQHWQAAIKKFIIEDGNSSEVFRNTIAA